MRFILSILVVFVSLVSVAQPDVAEKVVVEGKTFYKHKVEAGTTLWGLQQMYGVSSQEILEANPELSEGLKVDQVIYIPAGESALSAQQETSIYTVKNKETLYGLSKKFNTTVEELIRLNPELNEGLKKGQEIRVPGTISQDDHGLTEEQEEVESISEETEEDIPNPFVENEGQQEIEEKEVETVVFNDSMIEHRVMAQETMYSISKRFMVSINEIMKLNGLKSTTVKEGQILKIPVRKEDAEKVLHKQVPEDVVGPKTDHLLEFKKKDVYTIALFLPLHLDYGKGYSENVSELATHFYMGAAMAIDSLEQLGLTAQVHVFDTKNDSVTIAGLLKKASDLQTDLIIGPFFGKNLSQVAAYCKDQQIRMLIPVVAETKLLADNPWVYAGVPSDITLVEGLARHLLETYPKDNFILVKPLDKKSLPLYEAFRKAFYEMDVQGTRPALVETTVENFNTFMRRNVNNRFIVPTVDKSTAIKFMNNVNRSSFRSSKDEIFVYGMKEWVNFTDINSGFKNKYNFHFPTGNYIDYDAEPTVELNRKYRELYNTDLSKVAAQGYDVMLYFCAQFFLNGEPSNLLMNNFDMHQRSADNGFENTNVYIVGQKEYELHLVDRVSKK